MGCAEWPRAPIGACFAFVQDFAEHPIEQVAIRSGVLTAQDAYGQLDVEQASHGFAGGSINKQGLFAASMHNHAARRIDQQLPKLLQLLDRFRVDQENLVAGRDLEQTEIGPVTVFGDKLGIKADDGRIRHRFHQLIELWLLFD